MCVKPGLLAQNLTLNSDVVLKYKYMFGSHMGHLPLSDSWPKVCLVIYSDQNVLKMAAKMLPIKHCPIRPLSALIIMHTGISFFMTATNIFVLFKVMTKALTNLKDTVT